MSDSMMSDSSMSGMSESVRFDVDLLNGNLAGEQLGIAAYEAALGSGLLDDTTAAVARAFQSDHRKHAALLTEQIVARGGTAHQELAAEEYARSYPTLASAADILAFAIQLEAAATRAYVASVGGLRDRSLALLAAEIGGVEAQHWSTLLGASGANPVPSPLIEVQSQGASYGSTAA